MSYWFILPHINIFCNDYNTVFGGFGHRSPVFKDFLKTSSHFNFEDELKNAQD